MANSDLNCGECVHYEMSDSTCRLECPPVRWYGKAVPGFKPESLLAVWPKVRHDCRGCSRGTRMGAK